MAWTFTKPENKRDAEILNDIASIFRMCSVGGYGNWVITPPPTWKIEFYSMPAYPRFLRYARCGIEATVQFGGGDDEFKAMEDGQPFLSLSLQCSNLNYDTPNDLWIKASSAPLVSDVYESATPEQKAELDENKRVLDNQKSTGK